MIEHGVSGFLAESDDELRAYGGALAESAALRVEMAAAARARIEDLSSPPIILRSWLDVFEELS
jgi:hypothetical protein